MSVQGAIEEDWGQDLVSAKTDHSDVELTREQGRELFDRRARKLLGISGDEFLNRWDSGDFMDSDDPKVSSLAVLIPFTR